MLYAIKSQYAKDFPAAEQTQKFKEKFAQVATTATLALTDVVLRVATKQLIDDAMSLEDIAKHLENVKSRAVGIENVLSGWANQVENINGFFADLLDSYAEDAAKKYALAKDQIRFVILIDDLDRCLPQTTIGVLEGIKNYLFSNRCTYVLGLNSKVVYQGIQAKYPGLTIDGREYMEKILNFSFRLDEAHTSISKFSILEFKKLIHENQPLEQKYLDYFTIFGETLEGANFSNPRKIKRILNRFIIYMNSYESTLSKEKDENKIQVEHAVKFITMAEYFPAIFNLYVRKFADVNQHISALFDKSPNISLFEATFGVNLQGVYSDILQMRILFTLNPTRDIQEIVIQVRNLYKLTSEA